MNEREPERLDTLGRGMLAAFLVLGFALIWYFAGLRGVILLALTSVVVALVIAIAWTFGQFLAHWIRRRRARQAGLALPEPLAPFHRRFVWNLGRMTWQVPLFFISYS
jgi:hypothetical protein